MTDNRGEPPKPVLTLPDKPSIAVLPFTNLSSAPEQEYFADENVFRKGFAPCQSTPLNLYTVNLGEVPQRIFEVPHRKGL